MRVELRQPPKAKSARTWPGARLGTWFTGEELQGYSHTAQRFLSIESRFEGHRKGLDSQFLEPWWCCLPRTTKGVSGVLDERLKQHMEEMFGISA